MKDLPRSIVYATAIQPSDSPAPDPEPWRTV